MPCALEPLIDGYGTLMEVSFTDWISGNERFPEKSGLNAKPLCRPVRSAIESLRAWLGIQTVRSIDRGLTFLERFCPLARTRLDPILSPPWRRTRRE